MPRAHSAIGGRGLGADGDLHAEQSAHGRVLTCRHCAHGLECVEQNRRSGNWVGTFICPNCRSEYFYAYRWGRLLEKS